MTYRKRLFALISLDSLIVLFSIFISNYMFSWSHPDSIVIASAGILLLFYGFFARVHGLYRKAWEYASVGEVVTIAKAVSLSLLLTMATQSIIFDVTYNRILVVTWMIQLILIGGSRFGWRLFRERVFAKLDAKQKTLIIGAGEGGNMLVRQLQRDEQSNLRPVGFLDDDVNKHGLEIQGVRVLGAISELEKVVKRKEIQHITIAIPSLTKTEINEIFTLCMKTKVRTQIIPRIEDIAEGKISISQLKNVSVEDLLGRESVQLDDKELSTQLFKKTILVTGAGGSIGSEICRQVLRYKPDTLVLLGRGENSIYTIEMELLELPGNEEVTIVTEIADVQDREKMFTIMEKYRPDVVYHAAAHKHVPLMERNPEEAVKNNILGTKNTAEAADTYDVDTFVMVSTDKAVNPTNIMGATKRAAEMIVQSLSQSSNTRFVSVRFGNVLGSRGSVIPRFKAQITKGGPVTVTHPEIIRYFMTIPEASRLVIQAGGFAKGGEIFILDMGEPVRIVDLARNLITLSGFTEDEIGIEFSGIRPGEKLYEELLMDEEGLDGTSHEKIFVGKSTKMHYSEVIAKLEAIEAVMDDRIRVRQKLKEMVPTFVEAGDSKMPIVDNVIELEKVVTEKKTKPAAGEIVR